MYLGTGNILDEGELFLRYIQMEKSQEKINSKIVN